MTQMYYLNNNGKVVRKFVVRGENEDNTISSCGKIKDELSKVNATVIFEKTISEVAHFMVVSFDDHVMMAVWESNITTKVKIEDIVSSKVLIVKNSDDATEAKNRCADVRQLLKAHSGAVLAETEIAYGEYRLVLFFTDKEKMLIWERTLGVVGT